MNNQLTLAEQKALRAEATNVLDTVCKGCNVVAENRKKFKNKAAYNYCVRDCPIGKNLQVIGEKLLNARGTAEAIQEIEESYEQNEEMLLDDTNVEDSI